MAVVLAIDAGTTGVRTVAVDERRRARARIAYREFPQHFPRPGWVEHDADDIWRAVPDTLAEVVAALDGQTVAAIGITNQRETIGGVGPRDRAAAATARSCGRTAAPRARCDDAARRGRRAARARAHRARARPVLLGDEARVAAHARAASSADADLAFGTVDSWILWNLTGGRGRRARDRTVEREPHAALRHRRG